MSSKSLPFSIDQISKIIGNYPTPFHIYDEKAIVTNAQRLKNAFSWCHDFREYYAVKALPNPYILQILKDEGFGADCSSEAELVLAEKVGISGEKIMFTSNNTPAYEYQKAKDLGAIINLDDISHIEYLEKNCGMPHQICMRYNPGKLKEGNAIIGKPEEAKYGFTREQLFDGYQLAKKKGVKSFGLHTMVASNELDVEYFVETAEILFDLVLELHRETGIEFDFINLGGGLGIPYHPDQKPLDIETLANRIRVFFETKILANGLKPLGIFMESGRFITGPYGYLVSKVEHIKKTYKNYVGLDTSMQNLMRPGMYGAYHHITIMGKENQPHTFLCDVTGSLCENNDKFAIDRMLPEPVPGDIAVIHDSGAHGLAMGFNYNGKLRCAELLLKSDGSVQLIRRAETLNDLFATLDFSPWK